MNQVDFSQAGNAAQPSGSIWGSCPGPVLNDIGAGYYSHEDFLGGTDNFATGVGVGDGSPNTIDADAGTTIAKLTTAGGVMALVVSNTDNNAAALFKRPYGPLTLNSGKEFWLETRFNIGTLGDGDYGFFFGLAAAAVLTRDVVADDVASVAAGLVADSLAGMTIQKDNVGKVYAVIAKDAGGTVTIASDITNSSALNTSGQTGGSDGRFTITSGTYLKLGMRFDGKKSLYFYVNGVQVFKYTLTSTVANSTDDLGAIFCIKTGTTTARTFNIDWIRSAYRTRR